MALRDLPSVDAAVRRLDTTLPVALVTELVRGSLAESRSKMEAGLEVDPDLAISSIIRQIETMRHRQMVNATGVLLHTNLGRAPLHTDALAAAHKAAEGYGNLEFDLNKFARGGRGRYLAEQLTALTGAESAHVVNNNAAALLLALAALAPNGSVPVSRGELIEIGGSYRLPDLMASSGARLVEVGTTNRTRISDYERVIGDAALLLKVHPSNYRIVGFSEETSSAELAALGERQVVPFVYDVGSGLLDSETPWIDGPPPNWLAGEPGIRQELANGANLVLFSGDKLLGGPQAGIIVGTRSLVEALSSHPIARAVRINGPSLAALAATLDLYLDGRASEIPFWEMATRSGASLEGRLAKLLAAIEGDGAISGGASLLGAGSVPGLEIPTPVLLVHGPADRIWTELLAASPPILSRREGGTTIIDLRAVDPHDDQHISEALAEGSWR